MNANKTEQSSPLAQFLDQIRYRLRYDPEQGELIWVRPRQRRYKGTVAGYTPKSGYTYFKLGKERYSVAQVIWAYHHGWLPGRVYRGDGNPRNHRLENLYV